MPLKPRLRLELDRSSTENPAAEGDQEERPNHRRSQRSWEDGEQHLSEAEEEEQFEPSDAAEEEDQTEEEDRGEPLLVVR